MSEPAPLDQAYRSLRECLKQIRAMDHLKGDVDRWKLLRKSEESGTVFVDPTLERFREVASLHNKANQAANACYQEARGELLNARLPYTDTVIAFGYTKTLAFDVALALSDGIKLHPTSLENFTDVVLQTCYMWLEGHNVIRRELDRLEALMEKEYLDAKPAAGGESVPITVDEANRVAMRLAKKDRLFVNGGAREWARKIREATSKSCSLPTVKKTPLWITTMETTGRGRKKGGKPKVVAFTERVEATMGERDETLERLIAQQKVDYEPSPVEPDPPERLRRVKHRKRL